MLLSYFLAMQQVNQWASCWAASRPTPSPGAFETSFARVDALHHAVTEAIDDSRALLRRERRPTPAGLARQLQAEAEAGSSALRASREARARYYYKVVARLPGPKGCNEPATYVSIYDGTTRFALGERVERTPCQGRRGAFFVFQDLADAMLALRGRFPASSKLLGAPRALLRVRSDEEHERTAHCKALLWALTPVAEVDVPLPGRLERGSGSRTGEPRWR